MLSLDSAMLIKPKDDAKPTITALEALLDLKTLSPKQRDGIQEELDNVKTGIRGEKEAAYHIDFRLKDTENWAVIHDLRLQYNGRVAQIDHLLISGTFELFVVESKNVKTALRVNDNAEFEVKTRWGWKGMSSPVEQNKRHIRVLSEIMTDYELAPTRMGIRIAPKYHNWILVPPACNLSRKAVPDATILKMDMFDRGLEEHLDAKMFGGVFGIPRLCSSETVMELAYKLVRLHKPILFDFAAKFGITEVQRSPPPAPIRVEPVKVPVAKPVCEKCQVPVEAKVAAFCRSNEKRFGGKILCRTCQSTAPVKTVAPSPSVNISEALCNQCASPVEAKVAAFCRFNSRRFGKQIFCRSCQSATVAMS